MYYTENWRTCRYVCRTEHWALNHNTCYNRKSQARTANTCAFAGERSPPPCLFLLAAGDVAAVGCLVLWAHLKDSHLWTDTLHPVTLLISHLQLRLSSWSNTLYIFIHFCTKCLSERVEGKSFPFACTHVSFSKVINEFQLHLGWEGFI